MPQHRRYSVQSTYRLSAIKENIQCWQENPNATFCRKYRSKESDSSHFRRWRKDCSPADSRATHSKFLATSDITPQAVERSKRLDAVARRRGQTLAQMAISWLLKDIRVTTVICGASNTEQIKSNMSAIENMTFDAEELSEIDSILRT